MDDGCEIVGGMLELAPGVFAPPGAVRLQFARSAGPGGQNVNKLNTKAELWVRLDAVVGLDKPALARLRKLAGNRMTQSGHIHLRAEQQRSQEANRRIVFEHLRELLVRAARRPVTRRKTEPTAASKQRRLTSKRLRARLKSSRHCQPDGDC